MNNIKEINYKIALAEVDEILHFSDSSIVSKIPSSFKEYLKENKDTNYISNINPYMSLENQNISDEAKAIIALIYRSYIADEEEKKAFLKKAQKEFEDAEKQKKENYNPDNIFKEKKLYEEVAKESNDCKEKSLVIVKENVFSKIYNKIKNIIFKMINK